MRRTSAERWSILGKDCPACGAQSGKPCTATTTGRSHRAGQPIKDFHVKRVFAAGMEKRK